MSWPRPKDPAAFVKERCLLNQPFVKDQGQTIQEYLNTLVAKIGENIVVNHFTRYKVGEVDLKNKPVYKSMSF